MRAEVLTISVSMVPGQDGKHADVFGGIVESHLPCERKDAALAGSVCGNKLL